MDTRALYLDDGSTPGVDYSAFTAPVFSRHQPGEGLRLLEEKFSGYIENLSVKDVVLEAPNSKSKTLGSRELRFQQHLQFHPDVLAHNRHVRSIEKANITDDENDRERSASACREALGARDDLEDVAWRVAYLVQRDGRTPCKSRLFLLKREDECVLNLNHPDVQDLLQLSDVAPALAGHWALTLCLEDSTQRLLPHISSEARDDLLLLDVIAKSDAEIQDDEQEVSEEDWTSETTGFVRAANDRFSGSTSVDALRRYSRIFNAEV